MTRKIYVYCKEQKKLVPLEKSAEYMMLSVKRTVNNIVSDALPLNWKYANSHDKRGRPQFRDRREIRECVALANHHGENVTYDD